MAQGKKRLTVAYTEAARASLGAIWRWNAEHHGIGQAEAYLSFLTAEIDNLSVDYSKGHAVPARPEYQSVEIKKRSRGHGHVAVYLVDGGTVTVLGIFHTAQDWQGKLERGEF